MSEESGSASPTDLTPSETASKAGRGGTIPPAEYRFKNGNKFGSGRAPSAGLSIREEINEMAAANLTEEQIKAEARNPKNPFAKRAAAERMLRAMEYGDLSDFAGLLNGENKLEDLRAMGINTEVVKKFKQKTRRVPVSGGEGKTFEEVIDREIELHDRAGTDFDRIMDRTEGSPTQKHEFGADVGGVLAAIQNLSEDIADEINKDRAAEGQ